MCQFLSWIEKGDKVLFLTENQVYHTKQGKLLKEWCNDYDLIGHGAIRFYYGLEQDEGKNKECTDFSTPSPFPAKIVKAIKGGQFKGFPFPLVLLNKPLYDRYEADRKALDDRYWDLFAIPENRSEAWK